MKVNYIIYIGFILLPNLLSAQFVHTIKLDTTGNEELIARIFEIDLNTCDTAVVCAITFERGDIVYNQKNTKWFCSEYIVLNLHEDCVAGANVGWGPKSKFLSFAEFDPFDVMWVLSDKLLRYNTETLEFAGRGDMDSLFWNPKNSLNWIKGEFYFIAHRTRIEYDTLYHNDSMYFDVIPRYILGKASIARLDTNDASNSIILFDYPDTTAVILNMFSIRVDCDNYRTFVAVEGKGIEEVDFENESFIPYCDLKLFDIWIYSGAGVPNGTWEGCDVNIDLDLDDSSGEVDGAYKQVEECNLGEYRIVDEDFDLYADDKIDSIHISIMNILDADMEYLKIKNRATFTIKNNNTTHISIINNDPYYFIDLRYMLREIRYINEAVPITEGTRNIKFEVFAGNHSDIAWSRLILDDLLYVGRDTVVSVCNESINLNNLLSPWASPGGTWIPDVGADGTLSIVDTGRYIYKYIHEICINDTAQITLYIYPAISYDTENIDVTCPDGADGSIRIADISGGISDSLSYTVCLNGIEHDMWLIDNLTEDKYLLEVKQNANCYIKEEIIIEHTNDLSVSIGDDIYIYMPDDSLIIEAMIETIGDYQLKWYVDGELQGEESDLFTYYTNKNVVVSVELIDQDLCVTYDSINIYIEKPWYITIPNTIIPGDDIELDRKFYMVCSSHVKQIKSIVIFNRWGNLVYESKNLEPNNKNEPWWDGTSSGKKVVGGTYHYKVLIELNNGEEEEYKGGVYVLR